MCVCMFVNLCTVVTHASNCVSLHVWDTEDGHTVHNATCYTQATERKKGKEARKERRKEDMDKEMHGRGNANKVFSGDSHVSALGLRLSLSGRKYFYFFLRPHFRVFLDLYIILREEVISLLYRSISAMCPLCARLLLAHQTYSSTLELC